MRKMMCAAFTAIYLLYSASAGVSGAGLSTRFTPGLVPASMFIEPDDGVKPLTRLLDRAQNTIFVEAYILSDRTILRALERAATQGVHVDVLLEHHPFGLGSYPDGVQRELLSAGISVRWGSPRFVFTHAKFLVIDDSSAVISTANFSRSAFSGNREALVVDTQRGDVHDLSNIFRADWDRISPSFRSANLVVSPINARGDLQTFVESARHSIDIYAEELQDPRMERILASRAHAHVRVRILLPPSGLTGTGSPSSSLRSTMDIRPLSSPYVHAKVIVVDGREAFVGSENLSSTSLDHNREVGVFVRGSAVTRLESVFSSDWSRA